MSEVLDIAPRRQLPAVVVPLLVVLVALCVAVWTVLALLPPTVDGYGSPQHAHVYQPLRAKLLI